MGYNFLREGTEARTEGKSSPRRAYTKGDAFLCDTLGNLGFLILPSLKGYSSPALHQPSEGKGRHSHSPLAFTLKVIDLLHLHPFDTYNQEKRGRQGSSGLSSESSGPPPNQPGPDGQGRLLPKSSTKRVKRPGWGDKRRRRDSQAGEPGAPPASPAPGPPGPLRTRVTL